MRPKQNQDMSSLSLLELFRLEVASHCGSLTEGLLALEREPQSAQHLQAMMRAAHSLKGAARIVDRNTAVRVAHAMEDCLGAAQKGQLLLTRAHIDRLFQGVDLLKGIAAL